MVGAHEDSENPALPLFLNGCSLMAAVPWIRPIAALRLRYLRSLLIRCPKKVAGL